MKLKADNLRMSNVVFILGAGASKQAGAPLMGNFLDVAKDLLQSQRIEVDKRIQFENVFKAIGGLQSVHSKAQLDLNNIESIFTAFELGKVIQNVPGIKSIDIPKVIASLKELIVQTLEVTMQFPIKRDGYVRAPSQYENFAELINELRSKVVPKQTVSVLTFNYDVGVDLALFQAGLGPNYNLGSAKNDHNTVDLLKLHGSLNWAVEEASEEIHPLHFQEYFTKYEQRVRGGGSNSKIPIASQLKEFFASRASQKIPVKDLPVIVPPSWNKADYHATLSNVWAKAALHLAEADSIFIIGYSLPETDSFFRHLFALGSVGESALRRMVVFNPDLTGSVDQRFRSMLGPGSIARYQYVAKTFEDSIPHILGLFHKKTRD